MDQQAWDLLMKRLDSIELNQRVSNKNQLKLLGFRGWVLGAACMCGLLGGVVYDLLKV